MNKASFSKYTEKIRVALPFWFKMKKKPNNSVGLDFLNVFGMQLDEIEKMLDYASKQYFIDSADLEMVDIVYKANLPSYFDMESISGVHSSSTSLNIVDTLYKFFGLEERINSTGLAYEQNNICFIDNSNKIIFVRDTYDKSTQFPYGKIYVSKNGEVREFELTIHHVWNFFDEFGALVGCQRLRGEKNLSYKKRILDVFKNPANSTKTGLANGIARELNTREIRHWDDMSTDFIIKDRMVIVDTITVDGESFHDPHISDEGFIVIPRDEYKTKMTAEVSYIRGFSIEPLIEKSFNPVLSNELYDSDGSPTETMRMYVNRIKSEASIIWGDFSYNEAIWVKDDEDYYSNHFSFLPTRLDAKIGGFEKYGFAD